MTASVPLLLGDYLQAPTCPQLAATAYGNLGNLGNLGKADLAEFLAAWRSGLGVHHDS